MVESRKVLVAWARRAALASCSAAALMAGSAQAQTAPTPTTLPPVVVSPLYGNIHAFYGNINAFYGNIHAFYGNINAFYGNIHAFYGNIHAFTGGLSDGSSYLTGPNPFASQATGSAGYSLYAPSGYDPFWGIRNPYTNNPSRWVSYSAIQPFWQTESTNYEATMTAWSTAKTATDYQAIASQLQSLVSSADSFWGKAVKHPESAYWGSGEYQNGQAASSTTVSAIAKSLLTSAGVSYTATGAIDPASLSGVSQSDQAMFFVNFYDQLMSYSGTGHVDWWMGSANWSPALAAIAASVSENQTPITVGMLDFTATNGTANPKGRIVELGSDQFGTGHGAAVEGLIAGSVDGSGIMGVMPRGSVHVVVYDPYDATNTTNWTDVASGIAALTTPTISQSGWGHTDPGATVINASLGVPGWTLNPGWNTVFSSNSALAGGQAHNTILVVAAGNDGISQSANVPWNFAINPTLIVVGSVNAQGTISNFSNTPGTACLTATTAAAGTCTATLASRFIVAPGELILISDNSGNISRQTGTSLAAPLVSGAVGLLQARWPWLAKDPTDTANIILQSATPLGSKNGADPLYGVGELNIQASQSPLNWANVTLTPVVKGTPQQAVSATSLMTSGVAGTQSTWNSQNLYYVALEKVGSTIRDFQIPLSSNLVGQTVGTRGGEQQFQSYLGVALQSWMKSGSGFADASPVETGMSGFIQSSVPVGRAGGMQLRMSMAPNTEQLGFTQSALPYKTELALIGAKTALRFGVGSGAQALTSQPGLDQATDYQVSQGGANPLLGLASGGAYLDVRQEVVKGVSLNVGMTQRRDLRDPTLFGLTDPSTSYSATLYEASAEHAGVDIAASRNLTLHVGLTRLNENSALLGVQSTNASDLGRGAVTTGASLGFDLNLPLNMSLSATGMVANSKTDAGQSLHTLGSGLESSSGEVALSKFGLFAKTDRLRISVSQQLQVSSGKLGYDTYGVIDRQTGQLGVIHEAINPGAERTPVSAELLYGRILPRSGTEVSVYMRAGTDAYDASVGKPMDYLVGGKIRQVF